MIILDFDGVVVDSVDEVLVATHSALTGILDTRLENLSPGYVSQFRLNRCHIQPAGDLLLLGRWCLENANSPARIMSNVEWRALLAKASEPLKVRTEKFFSGRKKLIAHDRIGWLPLTRPYPKLWKKLLEIPKEQIVILTNKNRDAVVEITDHNGLQLDGSRIYAGDHGVTKIENLSRLFESHPAKSYLFVDDAVGNLKELREVFPPQKIDMALASWGYVGPGHEAEAKQHGFAIISEEDLVRRFNTLP